MVLDVKGAFLYGNARRDIYIELPREDNMANSGTYVGKLNKAMYGTRDAPQIWQDEVEGKMRSIGFTVSGLHTSVYYNKERQIIALAHVDDFLCIGRDKDLTWLHQELSKEYTLKKTMIGPGTEEDK